MSTVSSVLGTWDVTTNGWSGTLEISSVDGQGNLAGTLTITTNDQGIPTGEPSNPIQGYWNAPAQEIWFVRSVPLQIYTAYGYRYFRAPNAQERLVGFFETTFTAERHRFGWVASREIVG
jgi:hypothetical protein